MGIVYDAGTNTITATGYPALAPCTFQAIYDADVAGGWGVVLALGNSSFYFLCKLVIGDGLTPCYLTDSLKHIVFADGIVTAHNQSFIYVQKDCVATMGVLDSAPLKTSHGGCSFLSLESTWRTHFFGSPYSLGKLYCYSCAFAAVSTRHTFGLSHYQTFYNCTFAQNVYLNAATVMDAYNLTIEKVASGGGCTNPYGTMSLLKISDCLYALYGGGLTQTYRDFILRNNTYAYSNYPGGAYNTIFVDVDADVWAFNFYSTWTGKLYRKYTVNIKVSKVNGVSVQGATVKLHDKDGNEVFNVVTAADGSIAEQEVSYGYYDQANGDTMQGYGPFTLYIEKEGYVTYVAAGIVLDGTVDWQISLIETINLTIDALDAVLKTDRLKAEVTTGTLEAELVD